MFRNRYPLRSALFALALAVLLPGVLFFAGYTLEHRANEEGLSLTRQAIQRAAVTCYALEGAYPTSLAHLEAVYGVSVDETRYFVDYQYLGDNLMPDITVLPLWDRSSPQL